MLIPWYQYGTLLRWQNEADLVGIAERSEATNLDDGSPILS